MVDEVRVLRLLRRLTDDLGVLADAQAAAPAQRSDPLWLRGVKYTFVTAIESCVDVAQHICAAEGWGPPRDNGHAIELLGRHGVLEPELAASMRRAVGFRNVLVHDYVDVDDRIVLAQLEAPSDLKRYAHQVSVWLAPRR